MATTRPVGPRLRGPGELSQGQRLARALRAVLVLTNPVTALATAGCVLGLTRGAGRRVPAWVVAVVGALGTVLGVLLHASRTYLEPWFAIVARLRGATLRDNPAGMVAGLIGERWAGWLLGQVLWGLPLGLMIGAGVAARRRRLTAGWRDEQERAQERTHLSGADADRAKSKADRTTPALAEGQSWTEGVINLGVEPSGTPGNITGSQFASTHIVVTGPTGVGKTTTMLRFLEGILVRWVTARLPVIYFDFKADPDVVLALAGMAEATRRRFHVVSTSGPGGSTYNPIRHGTSEQVAARIMDTLANSADGGFSEPHHRIVGERWLIMSMLVLDDLIRQNAPVDARRDSRTWSRELADLARIMDPAELMAHRARLRGTARERAAGLLAELDADDNLVRSISGLRARVALLAETTAGRVLRDDAEGVDLEQVIRAGDVVVFSLDAASDKAAARVVGNLAITDLGRTFAALQARKWGKTSGKRAIVVLDEFGALQGSALKDLLERARSGGGTVVISAQADGNFTEVSEEFADAVWTNSGLVLMHQQPTSAETRAEAIGTQSALEETVQVQEDAALLGNTTRASGVGSLRSVERFIVHPNELKQLGQGEIILYSRVPRQISRVSVTAGRRWDELAPADTPRPWENTWGQDDTEHNDVIDLAASDDEAELPTSAPQPRKPARKAGRKAAGTPAGGAGSAPAPLDPWDDADSWDTSWAED